MHINFEFKARANDIHKLEEILLQQHPLFVGEDRQIDTYFNVDNGRLKLREGNIENALIHYERTNAATAKQSNVLLYQHAPDKLLKEILAKALGIKTIVDKKRRIYFIDNVKFHFDDVQQLGTFVEVEAIDKDGNLGIEKLQEQCVTYIDLFQINKKDFVAESYSDLLLARKSSTI
ncbi:MAG: class IV adenylate cyclase [Flavisolibacter sp.]